MCWESSNREHISGEVGRREKGMEMPAWPAWSPYGDTGDRESGQWVTQAFGLQQLLVVLELLLPLESVAVLEQLWTLVLRAL